MGKCEFKAIESPLVATRIAKAVLDI